MTTSIEILASFTMPIKITTTQREKENKLVMQIIKPYEFMYIKKDVYNLQNAYKSVNDRGTIKTLQAMTRENLHSILGGIIELNHVVEQLMDQKLTKAKADKLLEEIQTFVLPFNQLTDQEVVKAFKKVKKLKMPTWSEYDLRDLSYVGWNDKGTQRKYILLYQNEQLIGYSGTISPNIQRSVCAICKEISNVSLFLTTTKSSGDGTYTKKGNYICHDSIRCNKQLSDLAGLHNFIEVIDN